MRRYKRAIHIFRRDLRIEDNTALFHAFSVSDEVIPCFILDQRQIEDNDYRSDNAVIFMKGCLNGLDCSIRKSGGRLFILRGSPEDVIKRFLRDTDAGLVTLNRDYTPFSRKRDYVIERMCKKIGADFSSHADALINEPEDVLKNDSKPYTVFTPFFRKAREFPVRNPEKIKNKVFYSGKVAGETGIDNFKKISVPDNPRIRLKGGRKEALMLFENLKDLHDYDNVKDYPAKDMTSHLSAHLKFGTVSVREVLMRIKEELSEEHPLIRQLYWRDFFTHITYNFPYVIGKSFRRKYDNIKWSDDEKSFHAWKSGVTGFPIVDAGMRELKKTGFMHNRVRMITASFLVKDLHIYWRKGEKHFARHLIDYDPSVNNGNWQWSASTGCDAQPYFRIFNPWRQQKRFDPECEYIKKWVPELSGLSSKDIHDLEKGRVPVGIKYPEPIVDHKKESIRSRAMFASIKENK